MEKNMVSCSVFLSQQSVLPGQFDVQLRHHQQPGLVICSFLEDPNGKDGGFTMFYPRTPRKILQILP